MAPIKEDIKCPNCKRKNRIKVIEECNSNHVESIIDRTFFTIKCKTCNESITVDYPLKLVTDKYIIYYTPTENKAIKDKTKCEIKRVCDTYDDFKEKLLIFEDELNDVLIEFIKGFYKTQLDKETLSAMTDIRYNCKLENQIVFSLVGANKSIGCPIIFYEELLRRSKIKKIKHAELIDETTYRKYFRMRGLI